MFNTSESTATGRRGSFGLKVGALVAASSLMLAGGVAVASAAYADNNGQGQGQGKPDNTGKPDNGNGGGQNNGGDNGNGGNPNPGGGGGGGNGGEGGNGGVGGDTEKKIWVCHADANNGQGQGNLGQNGSGGENRVGFNLIHISTASWLNNHDRLHEEDFTLTDEQVAAGITCGGDGGSDPTPASLCNLESGQVVPFADNTAKDYTDALAAANSGTSTTWALSCPGGSTPAKRSAQPSAPICVVSGDSYEGVSSVTVPLVEATDASGNGDAAQAVADEAAEKALTDTLITKQQGDNIVPPWSGKYHSYTGYNWTTDTQARFAAGCSPNQRVLSAISAPAAATTPGKKPAAGSPQPGTVPVPTAGTPLPGAVPAGDGSSLPGLSVWALALLAVGAIGAAASGVSLAASRRG